MNHARRLSSFCVLLRILHFESILFLSFEISSVKMCCDDKHTSDTSNRRLSEPMRNNKLSLSEHRLLLYLSAMWVSCYWYGRMYISGDYDHKHKFGLEFLSASMGSWLWTIMVFLVVVLSRIWSCACYLFPFFASLSCQPCALWYMFLERDTKLWSIYH